jgi:hypothetical protein
MSKLLHCSLLPLDMQHESLQVGNRNMPWLTFERLAEGLETTRATYIAAAHRAKAKLRAADHALQRRHQDIAQAVPQVSAAWPLLPGQLKGCLACRCAAEDFGKQDDFCEIHRTSNTP